MEVISNSDDIYRPQTKLAKVMFLHLSVSHSVHKGGSASVHAGIADPPGADPHLRSACWGERAVRILLECILVLMSSRHIDGVTANLRFQ